MILGVSHTVLIVFCNIIHIGSIYLEPHVIYVLITTSRSSAHNGVHLILISKIVPIIII